MALSVEFAMSDRLTQALTDVRGDLKAHRGFIVCIENETMDLARDVFAASDSLDADLAQVRHALEGKECALIALSIDDKLSLITLTPESTKPRTRMMYAAGSSHLRDKGRMVGDKHVSAAAEITPNLFGHKEEDRIALRTESEVSKAQVTAAQEAELKTAATRVHAMHGMSASLSGDAKQAILGVKSGEHAAVTLAISRDVIVDKVVDSADAVNDIEIPADEPRFVFLRASEDRCVLAYVVPEGCKPRVKMQYATTKSCVVQSISAADVQVARSIELTAGVKLLDHVEAVLAARPVEDTAEEPKAPAQKAFMKGPRMFS